MFEYLDAKLKPLEDKVLNEERLTFEDGVTLFQSPDLLGVGRLANFVRERLNGNNAYFIHNRHINPTNICIHSCQFCAFGVKADAPNAYEKSLDEIFADAEAYQGGEV
ncbi:MAG: aminofutalosine synthase MqnE, partial [Nitrospinae bacterium]|nr:aminofutalosine synthase MqnE [Nitrospinota bacterium]MCH7501713.1 aminofutalosine synthase MqnE [Nitrospinota bacterium]